MKIALALLFVALTGFPGRCTDPTSPDANPIWVERMIAEFKAAPVGNPPQSIWRYEYHGETIYYVPPQCCDQFSILYNAEGVVLGYPDGGIGGAGDMRFPDFHTARTNEFCVWKDPRQRS